MLILLKNLAQNVLWSLVGVRQTNKQTKQFSTNFVVGVNFVADLYTHYKIGCCCKQTWTVRWQSLLNCADNYWLPDDLSCVHVVVGVTFISLKWFEIDSLLSFSPTSPLPLSPPASLSLCHAHARAHTHI